MKLKILQKHHITYTPERTVIIQKGEHLIATWLQRHKSVSMGLVEVVEQWLKDNKYKAVDYTQMYELHKQWRGKK